MIVALLAIGLLIIITGIKGNSAQVAMQFENDLLGSGSGSGFFVWVGAILIITLMGSIFEIPRAAKLFIVLILAVFVLKQNGLWSNAASAFSSVTAPAATTTAQTGQAVNALDQPAGSTLAAGAGSPAASAASSAVSSGIAGLTASLPAVQSALSSVGSTVGSLFSFL